MQEKPRAKAAPMDPQVRMAKVMSHPLRVAIVNALRQGVASPNELRRELGEGLSQVSYHFKVLRDYGCVELVRTEPRRGAVEHYYRAGEALKIPAPGIELSKRQRQLLADLAERGLANGLAADYGDAERRDVAAAVAALGEI